MAQLKKSEMVTLVRENLGLTGSADDVTDAHIYSRLREAEEDLYCEHDWPALEKIGTTILYTDGYWIEIIAHDLPVRKLIHVTVLDSSNSRIVAEITPSAYDESYIAELELGTTKGLPQKAMRFGGKLFFYPIADQDYHIQFRYYEIPHASSNPTSLCPIPGVDRVLVRLTTGYMYAALGEDAKGAMWEARANAALRKLDTKADSRVCMVRPFIAGT